MTPDPLRAACSRFAPEQAPNNARETSPETSPPELVARVQVDPDRVEQDLVRLVLTLVEFLRRLMEGQAVRRLEAASISADEAERLGLTLMRARGAIVDLCGRFGVLPEELNLDLGPLGPLM